MARSTGAGHFKTGERVNIQLKLDDYVCPTCRDPVRECASDELRCTGCGAAYPIVAGIPRFVATEDYSGSFGFQWNLHRRTQFDSYGGKPVSENRLFAATGWPREMLGARILEAGSDAARFTEILCSTGATVYSFDSSSAVEANALNNGGLPNVRLFQADNLAIPLREALFNHRLCLGVMQHTPDPRRSFFSLTRFVAPGGDIVIDVYRRSFAAALQWKYLSRLLTRRIPPASLYRFIETALPLLVGATRWLRSAAGRASTRLSPDEIARSTWSAIAGLGMGAI